MSQVGLKNLLFFLTSSQVMLILLVQGPDFENHCPRVWNLFVAIYLIGTRYLPNKLTH